jgi:ABC-type Fe3+-siderophore transport system permease subunit
LLVSFPTPFGLMPSVFAVISGLFMLGLSLISSWLVDRRNDFGEEEFGTIIIRVIISSLFGWLINLINFIKDPW